MKQKSDLKLVFGVNGPKILLQQMASVLPQSLVSRPNNDPRVCLLLVVSNCASCFSSGNTLVTVATGNLSEAEADRAGLVSTHAYAVLNVIKVQVLYVQVQVVQYVTISGPFCVYVYI